MTAESLKRPLPDEGGEEDGEEGEDAEVEAGGDVAKRTGRRKICVQLIPNERHRAVTFAKRKGGLIKKAAELSILCDAEVSVVVTCKNHKMTIYSSTPFDQVIKKYHTSRDWREINTRDIYPTYGDDAVSSASGDPSGAPAGEGSAYSAATRAARTGGHVVSASTKAQSLMAPHFIPGVPPYPGMMPPGYMPGAPMPPPYMPYGSGWPMHPAAPWYPPHGSAWSSPSGAAVNSASASAWVMPPGACPPGTSPSAMPPGACPPGMPHPGTCDLHMPLPRVATPLAPPGLAPPGMMPPMPLHEAELQHAMHPATGVMPQAIAHPAGIGPQPHGAMPSGAPPDRKWHSMQLQQQQSSAPVVPIPRKSTPPDPGGPGAHEPAPTMVTGEQPMGVPGATLGGTSGFQSRSAATSARHEPSSPEGRSAEL